VPVTGYVGLGFLVIWSLWLLVFILPESTVRSLGLCFLALGIFQCLISRSSGWLMFKISRVFHMDRATWEGLGQEGAQAWFLGLGLVMIGIGCIYLLRSLF